MSPRIYSDWKPSTAQIAPTLDYKPGNWHVVIAFGCRFVRRTGAKANESFLGVVLPIDTYTMNDPGKFDNGLAEHGREGVKDNAVLRRWVGVEVKFRQAIPRGRLGARPWFS